jgi:hypothetical protein
MNCEENIHNCPPPDVKREKELKSPPHVAFGLEREMQRDLCLATREKRETMGITSRIVGDLMRREMDSHELNGRSASSIIFDGIEM